MFLIVRIFLTAFLALVLIGCSHSAPSRTEVEQRLGRTPTNGTSDQKIDPRLLERSGERASGPDEKYGKAFHKNTKNANDYPVFQGSWKLVHGGFAVRFGSSSNSIEGVRYYFDEKGTLMWAETRFPPY
jgi:hypothetical protein